MADTSGPHGRPSIFDGAAWRKRARTALGTVLSLIVVVNLILVVTGILGYFGDVAFADSYGSARACASPADALTGQACRYQGQAQVLSTSSNSALEAKVAFESLPGRTFYVGWATVAAPDMTLLTVGEWVDAELWDGRVTRFAGRPTGSDPQTYHHIVYLEQAAVSGGVLLLIFVIWAVVVLRSEDRKAGLLERAQRQSSKVGGAGGPS